MFKNWTKITTKRLIALMIDSLIINLVMLLFGFSGILGTIISMIFLFFYIVIMELSPKHATIGKMIMKLKVTDNNGNEPSKKQILMRNFLKLILCLPTTDKNKGLHDMVAQTKVVEKNDII